MKIKLEHPYDKDWRFGYIIVNNNNRRCVHLYKNDKTRTTISYAKYLLSVKLGRYLINDEQADHIDEDKTNDNIGNLQILSLADNVKKSAKKPTMVTLICPICDEDFTVPKRQNYGANRIRTCSKICGYKKASITLKRKRNEAKM